MTTTAAELFRALSGLSAAALRTCSNHNWAPLVDSQANSTWRSVGRHAGQDGAVSEADRFSLLLTRAAIDHIGAIEGSIKTPYTPLILGRAGLEAAVRACHLLEAPDDRERVRRRLNAYLEAVYESRNMRTTLRNSKWALSRDDDSEDRIQETLRKAKQAGYETVSLGKGSRQRYWIGEKPSTLLEQSRILDDETTAGFGPIAWQTLSAAAHGLEHGIMRRAQPIPSPAGGELLLAIPADGPRLAVDLVMVPVALMRLMQACIKRFAWDAELLHEPTEQVKAAWDDALDAWRTRDNTTLAMRRGSGQITAQSPAWGA